MRRNIIKEVEKMSTRQRIFKLIVWGILVSAIGNVYTGECSDYIENKINEGCKYFEAGLIDDAISEFRSVISLKPDHGDAHYWLGCCYLTKELIDDAISEYRLAIKYGSARNLRYGVAHFNLGFCYIQKGWLEDAIYEIKKGLKINPKDPFGHGYLGSAYLLKGRVDEAIYELKLAIEYDLEYEYIDARNNLGICYIKKGLIDEAIAEFKKVLRLNSNDALAHTNLGAAYYAKGWLDEAISEYRKALEINPDNPETNHNLKQALEEKARQEKDTGTRYFTRWSWMDNKDLPNLPNNYLNEYLANPHIKAKIHIEVGDCFRGKGLTSLAIAISEYEKALEIIPDHPEAKRKLEEAKKEMRLWQQLEQLLGTSSLSSSLHNAYVKKKREEERNKKIYVDEYGKLKFRIFNYRW